MWQRLSDWVLYTRGRLEDTLARVFSGGHFWDRLAMSVCLSRGHDVFQYENAFCYNCKRTYHIGRIVQ
jgi:hypothetical protein